MIYLVLATQYESFHDSLIILMSVPLSMVGALLPLTLGLATLSIYSQISLIGIIAKHGILLAESANQRHDESYSIRVAMLRSVWGRGCARP